MSKLSFFIGEVDGTGYEARDKEDFLNRLSELIDEAEENGKQFFSITIENDE